MTIKVQCPCGAKYSFDVEPVDGRMPFAVKCPTCNADGTALANEQIASQMGAPIMRVATVAPVVEEEIAPILQPKPIAVTTVDRLRAERRKSQHASWLGWGVAVCILAIFGGWLWYVFFGTKPRLEYVLNIPGPEASWNTGFLNPETILLVNPSRATAHDVARDRDDWNTPLAANASSDLGAAQPKTFSDSNGVWICLGDKVLWLNKASGQIKQTIPISGQFQSFTPTASNILVVSSNSETTRVALQIDLATGQSATREIVVPRSEKHLMPNELPSDVQPTAGVLLSQALDEQKFNKPLTAMSSEFFSAGDNLVELRVKLLEPKVTYVKSIKSHLDGNTTASSSIADMEEDTFNDIKRDQTGGVKGIDESLYEVKLRRWTAEPPVEWTSQVRGVPMFFPMKTVDLVVAGKSLTVLDKQNRKLFDAKLSYAISDRFAPDRWDHHSAPGIETNGNLYFFDKGVLTAFALPGGDVRWRATSVGVTNILGDGAGVIYVATTTAAPEDIQYSDQLTFQNAHPLLLKVDAASGKILWEAENVGQQCYLSGKYLYTSSVTPGGIAIARGLAQALNAPDPDAPKYLHIRRLDPMTGKVLWDFYRQEAPDEFSFQQNRFLIRYSNRVQVWKFLDY